MISDHGGGNGPPTQPPHNNTAPCNHDAPPMHPKTWCNHTPCHDLRSRWENGPQTQSRNTTTPSEHDAPPMHLQRVDPPTPNTRIQLNTTYKLASHQDATPISHATVRKDHPEIGVKPPRPWSPTTWITHPTKSWTIFQRTHANLVALERKRVLLRTVQNTPTHSPNVAQIYFPFFCFSTNDLQWVRNICYHYFVVTASMGPFSCLAGLKLIYTGNRCLKMPALNTESKFPESSDLIKLHSRCVELM